MSATTDGCQWLSHCGRQAVDWEPTAAEYDSVCRQVHVAVDSEHCLLKAVDRRSITDSIETQRVLVCRQLTRSCRSLRKFSDSELFSDWDFEEIYESLLSEAVDWMAMMVLLEN